MPSADQWVGRSDTRGRVTLPREFAGSTLLVEIISENELRVRKARAELLDEQLPPLTTLQPLSDEARDEFLAALDAPPQPNEALKRLMRGE